mmetsp:Transcript_38898/g.111162  ORF Transcript_38898/g.111162 Transcript_38898/m.111162 type:complete len:258 (-) Transcript_38898:1459-2232(-)
MSQLRHPDENYTRTLWMRAKQSIHHTGSQKPKRWSLALMPPKPPPPASSIYRCPSNECITHVGQFSCVVPVFVVMSASLSKATTASTCIVWGNISTAHALVGTHRLPSSPLPALVEGEHNSMTLELSDSGLQDTYTSRLTLWHPLRALSTVECSPALGGSTTAHTSIPSTASPPICSMTWPMTSSALPATNRALLMPLACAFWMAFWTASSLLSMPTTRTDGCCLAAHRPMVPVPQHTSSRMVGLSSDRHSQSIARW